MSGIHRTRIDWCDSTWNPVTGQTHDRKTITGYFLMSEPTQFTKVQKPIISDAETGFPERVIEDTVKPVAVKPKNIQWVDDPAGNVGRCPNCDSTVDDEVYGGEWCKFCVQRLDWSEQPQ